MTTTASRIKIDFLARPTFRCGRCGGNVVFDKDDGYTCIQCGRAHDNHGNLLVRICFAKKGNGNGHSA